MNIWIALAIVGPLTWIGAEPLEDRIVQKNIDGTISGKCPPVYSSQCSGVFLDGEFLYMVADVDGLTYAWTFPETFPAVNGTFDRVGPLPGGQAHDPEFSWDPGVRVRAGYRFEPQAWELSLDWTYYYTNSQSSASIPSLATNILIATWFPSGFFAAEYLALNASAEWMLTLNTVDLYLGRAAFATHSLSIEPFIAFRGAFVHQNFTTSYTQGEFFNESGSNITSVQMTMKNHFDGWGLRPGLKTHWYLTKSWSLYANGACSLLYGQFITKQNAQIAGDTYRNVVSAQDAYFQSAFEIDVGLGIAWELFFDGETKHVSLATGYELMSWFDQNQLFNYYFIDRMPGFGVPSQGDLGLQGINISARFDF